MTDIDREYLLWQQRVDAILVRKIGLTINSLPDLTDTAGLYESGMGPNEAAETVLYDQGVEFNGGI